MVGIIRGIQNNQHILNLFSVIYFSLYKLLVHPIYSITVISKCHILASPGGLSKIFLAGQPCPSLLRKASDLLDVLGTKSDLHDLLYMCYVCMSKSIPRKAVICSV